MLCAVIYRPPKYNKDFVNDISDFLAKMTPQYDCVLLVGDFNILFLSTIGLLTVPLPVSSLFHLTSSHNSQERLAVLKSPQPVWKHPLNCVRASCNFLLTKLLPQGSSFQLQPLIPQIQPLVKLCLKSVIL